MPCLYGPDNTANKAASTPSELKWRITVFVVWISVRRHRESHRGNDGEVHHHLIVWLGRFPCRVLVKGYQDAYVLDD